jgi:hypothetical protein
MSGLGIGRYFILSIRLVNLAVCLLILFPQTFFIANLSNAAVILLIMTLGLKTGNVKIVLIEIPFLLLPLVLIYLGHPLKKTGFDITHVKRLMGLTSTSVSVTGCNHTTIPF